ncbi:hypothetical protein BV898_18033 [Hypsibius exemplaris]|uniref:Uncharacterized protein n=1 Tax=Hypsibius exemplaris TaxID=2072580 RepID=A0A9X6NGL7_HYPEX|nr:hypothetical protein BV898_18033 [Hypsibius exemplaris]
MYRVPVTVYGTYYPNHGVESKGSVDSLVGSAVPCLSQKAVVVLTTEDGQRWNPEAANDGNYIEISGIQTGTKITINSQNMFGMMSDGVSYFVKFDTDSSNMTNMVLDDGITVQQSMNPSLRLALGLGVPLTVIAIIAMVVTTVVYTRWPTIQKRRDEKQCKAVHLVECAKRDKRIGLYPGFIPNENGQALRLATTYEISMRQATESKMITETLRKPKAVAVTDTEV